ncbi:MAG: radical SAM protein, partial [Acidimicrobiales bacterium]
VGCAYDCGFCDLPGLAYQTRGAEQVLAALREAARDQALPARHVLISGGSPRRAHYEVFLATCAEVIAGSPLPVDVMFSPMVNEIAAVDRFVDAGVAGLAINLELYSPHAAQKVLKTKYLVARNHFEATVLRAVQRLGTRGRVRSLIIVGLEPAEETLAGVEYLASLGCDPVLSPFRPASGIALHDVPPPKADELAAILDASREIVARYGVALGPDCVPCQHNTLTFPWDSRSGQA